MQNDESIPELDSRDTEMLARDEYGFDVSDATVREALPAFFAALRGIKR